MNNPLEQFTRREEKRIEIDHSFLNNLEADLFASEKTRAPKKRLWQFTLLIPVAAALLIISLVYRPFSDDAPTANATTLLELFTPDIHDQLRRLELEREHYFDDGTTLSEQTTYWTRGQSLRAEGKRLKSNETEAESLYSFLFSAEEAQECSHYFREKENTLGSVSCRPVSQPRLHLGLNTPNSHFDISHTETLQNENDFASFSLEWSSKRPLEKSGQSHGFSGGSRIAIRGPIRPGEDDPSQPEYYNVERDGVYHHRTIISSTSAFELDQITFQLRPDIGGSRRLSQILRYDFTTNELTEIPYQEVRSYPIHDLYQEYFRIPLYIAAHEDEFSPYAKTSFEERDGQQVTHIKYTVPEKHRKELELILLDTDIGSVDFWYLPYEGQLLEYEVRDAQGRLIESTQALSDETIEEPIDVLSVNAWLQEYK